MKKSTSGIEDAYDFFFGAFFAGMPLWALFTEVYSVARGSEGVDELMEFVLFLFIFFLVGMLFIMNGLDKIRRNWRTKRKGFVGYGKVISIEPTGVLINKQPQLKATIRTYIPQLNVIINLEEVVGLGESPFEFDSIVAVKYWDFDINILYEVEDTDSLPVKVQEVLLGKVVTKEEKSESAWDSLDTENWTLTKDAFPEDIGITRQEDADMSYSDDEPPAILRKPEKTRGDIVNMWLLRILKCMIIYAVYVVAIMIIEFKFL